MMEPSGFSKKSHTHARRNFTVDICLAAPSALCVLDTTGGMQGLSKMLASTRFRSPITWRNTAGEERG